MPDIARLSETAEHDVALMSIGAWPMQPVPTTGVRLPHEITFFIANSVKERVEQLATVEYARVLLFRPDAIRPVVIPSWIESALERLQELASSPPNWDGYGAPSVHPAAIVASLTFLHQVATRSGPRPAIVSTGSGNIQFEWRAAGTGIDVEIGPESQYCASLFVDGREVDEWVGDIHQGIDPNLAHAIAFGTRHA